MQFLCFEDIVENKSLDRKPFKFGHKLLGHPALTLENIGNVLPTLPKQNVMFSKGLLQNGDDFEGTFRRRPKDKTLLETIEDIRTSDSYIMVSRPELDSTFQDLRNDLVEDVRTLMRSRGLGNEPIDPHLYLFIASPNSVTPFHIDRYSTLLMQFRGQKTVSVFPQWDERVVRAEDREAYMARSKTKLPWSSEIDNLGQSFTFQPGQTLHIPFAAGHHVRNGPGDVSISMSIIFKTRESLRWQRALEFNHAIRRKLHRFGMKPSAVGQHDWLDTSKAGIWQLNKRFRDRSLTD